MMKRILLLLAVLLTACGAQSSPTTPVPSATPPPVAQAAPPPKTTDTPVPSPLPPTPTTPLSPTFVLYRDARGGFTIELPENWNRRALPEGVGVTATAFNATARYLLSLALLDEPLSATRQAQIVEEIKNSLLDPYLVQAPDFSAASDPATGRYVLRGTATLTGTPTTIEVSLEQTDAGVLILQSWLAPTQLWPDFVDLFKQPMEASLTVDAAALRRLSP